jgi:hypothetical protein
MIQLSEEQRTTVENGGAIRMLSPEFSTEVVVMRADLFDSVKELLDEERQRQIIARIAMKNAVQRMSEQP